MYERVGPHSASIVTQLSLLLGQLGKPGVLSLKRFKLEFGHKPDCNSHYRPRLSSGDSKGGRIIADGGYVSLRSFSFQRCNSTRTKMIID